MDKADFIHLVRLSEQASAADSRGYRRNVAAFAALGYLWVIGCFVLALGLAGWTLNALLHERFRGGYFMLLLAAASLLWASLRALWIRLDAPQGTELMPADAPALFEALGRIRQKINGPPIHHVLLNDQFNASISQIPRFGLMGGAVNYLSIGLPLLMALDRPRFLAVLAHEYGHLRGSHGQFAAWIYRTRLSWAMLEHQMRHDQGLVAIATQAFLRWYFPRFLAKTFALARQDEYEADQIAGRLLGTAVAGAALSEIALKGAWLSTDFWPLHWRAAAACAQPQGPFAAMRRLLALPVPDEFARDALRQSLRQISDVDDTHPVLRDRLDALDASQNLPTWSAQPALDLLGSQRDTWQAHFDKQWCRDNAASWKLHHAYLNRVRQRMAALSASRERNNADQMTELGCLTSRLGQPADGRPCFERALQLDPVHAGGLRGLAVCLGSDEHNLRMDCLQHLFDHSTNHRHWACTVAVRTLEASAPPDDAPLKLWRERLRLAEQAEQRAWEELMTTPFFHSISRHDLNDFEQGECQAGLVRCQPVRRAWLVRKNLAEFPWRRCYLLFVELPGLEDDERYTLCRSLERSLDLPGTVLVLWAGQSPTLADIGQNVQGVFYTRERS